MEAKTRRPAAAAVRRLNDIHGTAPQSNRKSVSEVEANPDTPDIKLRRSVSADLPVIAFGYWKGFE